LAVQVALRDTPKAWLDGQVQFLRLMGFASEQFDMLGGLQALTEEQLAGFYDPAGDILYVSKDLDPENSNMALVHEVVHALQDQHFDLGRRMAEAKTSDELSALQILAEGDATSAMIDMPRGNDRIPQMISERLSEFSAFVAQATVSEVEVPALLRRSILAPYGDGLLLVERLRATGDWASVNALWQSAPRTTAELLHPGRPRIAVTLPAAPLWRQHAASYDDVTGEQTLRLVLEEWDSLAGAAASADGLVGDRLSVFSAAEGSALAWQMAFQTREDIDQVVRSLKKGLFKTSAWSKPLSDTRPLTRGCDTDATGNPMALLRDGLRVVLTVQSRKVEAADLACRHIVDWAKSALSQTAH
jgi:hypothetical protein